MKPLISIVVPIYNQEKYIEECLASLFSQAEAQPKGRIELILIDDGSTDRSAALCEARIGRSPEVRARLIRQTNRGLIAARKIGVEAAEGEYILCVDSDDCLQGGALSCLTEILEAEEVDIILFNATSDPENKTPLFSYPFENGKVFAGAEKYELYRLLCGTDKLNNIWAKCVRRTLFLEEEVYRDIGGISNGEDLYQSMPLVDRAEKILFLDRVLYYYRVNRASMSRSYNPRHFSSEKKVSARRLEYARKWSREGDELVRSAERWICRILRDVSRKLFVSDLPWARIAEETRRLREDEFYRTYYLRSRADRNPRDFVLKSPLPLMQVWKALYALKPDGRGRRSG